MKKVTLEIISKEGKCWQEVGSVHTVGLVTEAGLCTKLLHSAYPAAFQLMYSTEENPGAIEVTCPDGVITARLTRNS